MIFSTLICRFENSQPRTSSERYWLSQGQSFDHSQCKLSELPILLVVYVDRTDPIELTHRETRSVKCLLETSLAESAIQIAPVGIRVLSKS